MEQIADKHPDQFEVVLNEDFVVTQNVSKFALLQFQCDIGFKKSDKPHKKGRKFTFCKLYSNGKHIKVWTQRN